MYHIFFIKSSVSGSLGCLCLGAVVSNAAMDIGVHISFWVRVFSRICPGVGLLDHIVILFFVF